MLFFLDGNTESVCYVESLKEQKMSIFSHLYSFSRSNVLYSNAENRVAALEQMVSIYHDQPAELKERMKEALEQLADANAQLEKYRRTYGNLSTLPSDVAHLAEQLRTKEEELERLRMSVTQQTEVSFFSNSSLYNTYKLTCHAL
jgi:predicted  nucleic acid-binding Zn-ribbon protein